MTFTLNFKYALLALTYTSTALAGNHLHFLRAEDVLFRPYSQQLSRRSTTTVSTNSTDGLNADGSLNVTKWDDLTNAACTSRLESLPQSSNPSGTCICYNLPSLSTDTGVFEADLRLYKVSEPRGAWAGIPPEDIMVALRYNGATVTPVKVNESTSNSSSLTRRADSVTLMRSYMFVGQIDSSKMEANLSMSDIESYVMPILTLSAKNSSGDLLSTNVSANEASFITGVFSKEVVLSDIAAAQEAVNVQVAGLKNGTVAFVLPGVQLMIFPVGLIITGVWLLVGVLAYGYGTYERIRYAEMYKRRQAVKVPRGKTF